MQLHESIEITKDIIISILNHRRGLSNTKSVEFNKLVMREQALHALLSLAQKFNEASTELPEKKTNNIMGVLTEEAVSYNRAIDNCTAVYVKLKEKNQ